MIEHLMREPHVSQLDASGRMVTVGQDAQACRVCGGTNLIRLPLGIYTPFFALRVNVELDPYALYSRRGSLQVGDARASLRNRMFRLVRRLGWDSSVKANRRPFRTMCQYCTACHSVMPCHEFSTESLAGLYRDYRSASYNHDRISVEPGYKRIAARVGNDPVELRARNAGVEKFIAPYIDLVPRGLLVDLGGSDGRFIPPSLVEAFESVEVVDLSDAPVHASLAGRAVKKVAAARPGAASLLLCMHVLEHVGNPRAFLLDALRYLQAGGWAYLEVPLELTREMCAQFEARVIDEPFFIHEHINLYDAGGLGALVRSIAGLKLVADSSENIDVGWGATTVGRYLLRREA